MRSRITTLIAAVALALVPASALSATSAEKKAELQRIERELAILDARAGSAAAEANSAIMAAEEIRGELRTTRTDLATARRDLARSRARLAKRLRSLYVNPEPTLPELLVSGHSLGDIVETSRLIDRTAQADAAVLKTTRGRRTELGQLHEKLARDSRVAEERATRARAQRERVQVLLAARRHVLDSVRGELKELLEQERARQRRQAVLKRQTGTSVPRSAAAAPAIPLPGGSHLFPIAGPTRFTDDWLFSRPGGRYHQGIDLFAERGTPLVAVAGGSLFRVGWNGLGGWRLWLRDDAGTTYYYAHLESFADVAGEGARVSRGTVIGYAGDSGSARGTGVHLHFEIHPGGGGPVRPWPYVTSWPRAG
ncbi:MAG: peptidoglycan DD-metalloendopeptidase family protein [Thermoleophilia bacterium]|nr:peptidoglycan DD-metalloendopeptidase family protein [Thermoleophilia bacterium]